MSNQSKTPKFCLRVATDKGYIEYISRRGQREWPKNVAQAIANRLNSKDGSIVYLLPVTGD